MAWQPLTVKLTTRQGQPVQGSVTAHGAAIAGGKISETVHTDAWGIADFYPLPPGEYNATCVLDESKINTSRSILVGPRRPNRIEVTCPMGPPGTFQLAFNIRPPEPLKKIPLYYFAHIDPRTLLFAGGRWSVPDEDVVLLVDSTGKVLGQTSYKQVTRHEPIDGTAGYFVNFLEKLPADFALDPPRPIAAYDSAIQLWPLVKDPGAGEEGASERPALVRLTGAALQNLPEVEPVAGQTATVTVEAEKREFWDQVMADLKRMKMYEGLANATSERR
jgi:hypothetical protein